MAGSSDLRIFCFDDPRFADAVEESLTKLVSSIQERARSTFISEHNTLRLNHGSTWEHSAREPTPDVQMQTLSAEWTLPFRDIANNDLGLMGRCIKPMNEQLERQFAQNIYATVGEAAERVGNIVDAKAAGSFAHSMLEMLRKIELGVDRDGAVRMPQIHVAPGTFERIEKELQEVPADLTAEIEFVKTQKIEEALKREEARKAKFKRDAS